MENFIFYAVNEHFLQFVPSKVDTFHENDPSWMNGLIKN